MKRLFLLSLLLGLWTSMQALPYPPEIEGAKEFVYKKTPQGELKLWAFFPEGHCASDSRPAVVFFFGGGWKKGSPAQFVKQCEYLASRGMVAMTADYRVLSRHNTKAVACVEDGKSAVRWIRQNSSKLGVDPTRVAAGGGSAGGHVAASIGLIKGFEPKGEDMSVSSQPNALLLFNPAVTLVSIPGKYEFPEEKSATMEERTGVSPKELSPYFHIRKELPPSIIFHGTADSAVDHKTVELFQKKMKKAGNECRLESFLSQPHGFFNYGKLGNAPFRQTMILSDKFLQDLDWIKGKPSIVEFLKSE